ncbi:hypothetical protein SSPIM334S_08246 [Streptomyces spiroverticillatus]
MPLRIGELSERTGTPRRLLRYYEERGLIAAHRTPNGYRSYDDCSVDRVLQIRGLLDVGLPTRIIEEILPCLDTPRAIHLPDAPAGLLDVLALERDRMTARIGVLVRNRDSVAAYLASLTPAPPRSSAVPPASGPPRVRPPHRGGPRPPRDGAAGPPPGRA